MKIATTLILLLISITVFSQDKWDRQDKADWHDADFAFYQGDYAFARLLLEPLYTKHQDNIQLNFELAACYVELESESSKALTLLEDTYRKGHKESTFYLAKALHQNYRFDDALAKYSEYQSYPQKEQTQARIQKCIAESRAAKKLIEEPVDVQVTNLGPGVNTSNQEYVPIVTPENTQLYFTSRRPNSTGKLKDPNNEFFEDIYHSSYNGDSWGDAVQLGKNINTKTHDATVAISKDGQQMMLYRTNKNLTGGDIYISTKNGASWSEPEKLPENINSPYQEASACFGADNSTIFFSSNRPGGYGGKDLYRVVRLPNGEWSLPKNLGAAINTPYDEDAPFMDIDGRTLYFSSNGHQTMGGYDVFKSTNLFKEVWSQPENLGHPVNTVFNDIYLSLDAGGRKGYYSSAQIGGFGQQDIYVIDFIYRQQTQLVIKGQLQAANGNPVSGSITVLNDQTKALEGVYKSNENTGKFIMILNPLVEYSVVIESDGKGSLKDELFYLFPEEEETEMELSPYILLKQ